MSDQNGAKSDILRSHFHLVVTVAIVLVFLVVARPLLVPLAIAILVWNLLNALILRLGGLPIGASAHPPRWAAIGGAVVLILVVAAIVMEILATQAGAIADAAPGFLDRLDSVSNQMVATLGTETAETVQRMVTEYDYVSGVSGVVGEAESVMLTVVLVGLYVGFLFVEEAKLPAKLAALFPRKPASERVHGVLLKVSKSMRRYVWLLTVVGLMKAVASYAVLKPIGLDFAETWALLIFVLNFIPIVGPAIAVALPAALAVVQFDTLWQPVVVALALGLIQFLIGSVIQPAYLGRSLNLSPLVIILALAVWGAIWGAVGIFLAVPIMAMVMIVCSHIPDLRWVAVVLSADGSLDPDEE